MAINGEEGDRVTVSYVEKAKDHRELAKVN
jgi:hypothetical protein